MKSPDTDKNKKEENNLIKTIQRRLSKPKSSRIRFTFKELVNRNKKVK